MLSVHLKLKLSYTDMVPIKSFYSSQINFHTLKSQTLTETEKWNNYQSYPLCKTNNQPIYNNGLHISTVAEITLPLLCIRIYINCFELFVLCKDHCTGHSRRLWNMCNEILVCVTKYFAATFSLIGYMFPWTTFRN